MGCWGGICTFDRARFLAEVVPAFKAGEQHPLFAFGLEHTKRSREPAFEGLADVIATFDDELAASTLDGDFTAAAGWSYWDLCMLFERVVIGTCVTAYGFVGREYRASFLLTSDHVTGGDAESDALVEAIDQRWRYWTHGSGGYAEGWNGWLDVVETRQFAAFLARAEPDPDDHEPDESMERIARIRALTDHAVERGLGVAWGGDLAFVYGRPVLDLDGWRKIPEIG